MGSFLSFYAKLDALETLVETMKKKKVQGINLTVGISEKTSDFGSNAQMYVEQTKEDRDAKKKPFTVAWGKVYYTDGKICVAERKSSRQEQAPSNVSQNNDDLPF